MEEWLTQDGLRKLAAEHGHTVSNVQIGRWHRFGLLPEPRPRPQGKGHGSAKSIYPPRTRAQLLRLCELREEKHERTPHYLAWYLWWEYREVPAARVREFLEAVAGGWDDAVAERRDMSAEELAADVGAAVAPDKRLPPEAKVVSRLRRRVGRDGVPGFTSLLLLPSGGEVDPQRVVEGFGLQFLFGSLLSQQMLGESDVLEVAEASREALLTLHSEHLAALSDADLRRARWRLQGALGQVQGLRPVFRQVGGPSAEALLDLLVPTRAAEQARLLLLLEPLLSDPSHAAPSASEGGVTIADLGAAFEFLELLMREVPVLIDREILTPQRLRTASHDAAQFERLIVAIWAFTRDNPHEFEALLAAHPEERWRLYPPDAAEESTA